ncbi:jg14413 [Pararge aegeria aegeria]|uniref:Jg14413 protein n=1 Tax=Pararge aegeria aegeria TaxID=348720 RepID=A0A8S4RWK3_9NEOP|nr:jg14413 [Pararge aegeria aegeria]
MQDNKRASAVIDKGVYLVHREEAKTSIQSTPTVSLNKLTKEDEIVKKSSWYTSSVPTFAHYVTLVLLGVVAVLACNATAATHWSKKGWKLNQNPAATVYRVLWSTCEPVLFAFTGTFFVLHSSISETMLIGLGILLLCVTVRLMITALACWQLTLKEKIFVCCTWIPKTVVEAVLCPLAIDTILMTGTRKEELVYAEELMRIIVQAILVSTPIGFLLTNNLGPMLLSKSQPECESKTESTKRKSNGSVSEDSRL